MLYGAMECVLHLLICAHCMLEYLGFYWQKFEPLTFLCQRSIRLIFVHQQLDLFWFERRVEYLVQTRVSLFTVNEFCHLLHCEVGSTLGPPEEKREWGHNKDKWQKSWLWVKLCDIYIHNSNAEKINCGKRRWRRGGVIKAPRDVKSESNKHAEVEEED